jgi:hypothetical protein
MIGLLRVHGLALGPQEEHLYVRFGHHRVASNSRSKRCHACRVGHVWRCYDEALAGTIGRFGVQSLALQLWASMLLGAAFCSAFSSISLVLLGMIIICCDALSWLLSPCRLALLFAHAIPRAHHPCCSVLHLPPFALAPLRC